MRFNRRQASLLATIAYCIVVGLTAIWMDKPEATFWLVAIILVVLPLEIIGYITGTNG